MRQFLLGTTALVAAAALSTTASAADKIKLSLGGFFVGAVAYVDDDTVGTTDLKDFAFGQNSEVHFKGKTTLDNGIEIGFAAELELERDGNGDGASADTIDEVYMSVKGGLGQLQFGEQDGIGDQMSFMAPYITKYVRPNDSELYFPTFQPISLRTDVGNDTQVSEDGRKIIYITPRLAGFQAGISYTPEPTKGGQGIRTSNLSQRDAADGAGAYSSTLEFGANYAGEFNGISIEVGGTYLTADAELDGADDWNEWGVGGEIGFEIPNGGGKLAVGGAYRDANHNTGASLADDDNEFSTWDVGLRYGIGPWMIGGYYITGESDPVGALNTQEGRAYTAELGYKVGPGIQIAAGVQFWEYESDLVNGVSQSSIVNGESTVVFVETGLSF